MAFAIFSMLWVEQAGTSKEMLYPVKSRCVGGRLFDRKALLKTSASCPTHLSTVRSARMTLP